MTTALAITRERTDEPDRLCEWRAICRKNEGKISIFDRGFLFADGVYEVTAVIGGKLVDYEPHMERLDRSLKRNPDGLAMQQGRTQGDA